MELINPTPLPGLAFRQFDQDGDLDCVVTLRGTFVHAQGEVAQWQDEQMPLQWQDSYEGEPHTSLLLHQTDLVPEKPGTDVTFLGKSHVPDRSEKAWQCGIRIGPLDKRVHVSGPRSWHPIIKPARWPFRKEDQVVGWELGEPEPVENVPIDWHLASGGRNFFDGQTTDPDPDNPLGRGRLGASEHWEDHLIPAPQIFAGAAPAHGDAPVGLGPIPPFWRPRYQYAGTYDTDWEENRHPLLPEDFNPLFWQCAPADQIVMPWLRGDEHYRLFRLHPEHAVAEGYLPKVGFAVRVDEEPWNPLHLDGVQFDWRDDALLLLTWRVRFPLPDAQGVKLHLGWHWLDERKVTI